MSVVTLVAKGSLDARLFVICELLPEQAKIADKFAIVRNMQFQQQGHTAPELYTGFLRGDRPAIGSLISKLHSEAGLRGALPPNIYIGDENHVGRPGFPGKVHEAFIPDSRTASLRMASGLTSERISERRGFPLRRRALLDYDNGAAVGRRSYRGLAALPVAQRSPLARSILSNLCDARFGSIGGR
jgi:hypothetical protein